MHCTNQRQARLTLQALPMVQSVEVFGDRLHVALTPGAQSVQVAAALATAGLPCEAIVEAEPSLEDVFMELTRGQS